MTAQAWDFVVVGAGPAGSMAALRLSRAGHRVLMVDRSGFPRWKVCGCCLNGVALAELSAVGLAELPARLGARPLDRVVLAAGGRSARLALPAGVALSRTALDAALIEAAVDAGTEFRPQTRAEFGERKESGVSVVLHSAAGATTVSTRYVVAADGLSGSFIRRVPGVQVHISKDARVGAGVELPAGHPTSTAYESGAIYMAVGQGGYVGLVRLESGALDVAAAFDPDFIRKVGGLRAAADRVVAESGLPVPDMREVEWRGTPQLTRCAALPGDLPIFLLGDARAYVEPFTGQGMAWAMRSGRLLADYVSTSAGQARCAGGWQGHIGRETWWERQRCRWLTRLLRHPRCVRMAVGALRIMPGVARPLVRSLNSPSRFVARSSSLLSRDATVT